VSSWVGLVLYLRLVHCPLSRSAFPMLPGCRVGQLHTVAVDEAGSLHVAHRLLLQLVCQDAAWSTAATRTDSSYYGSSCDPGSDTRPGIGRLGRLHGHMLVDISGILCTSAVKPAEWRTAWV
jgi:hypothetical protein